MTDAEVQKPAATEPSPAAQNVRASGLPPAAGSRRRARALLCDGASRVLRNAARLLQGPSSSQTEPVKNAQKLGPPPLSPWHFSRPIAAAFAFPSAALARRASPHHVAATA
jgi:hypothetical protein